MGQGGTNANAKQDKVIMSYLNTKQALISHLLSNLPTGVTADDVAFENLPINPSGKTLWLAAYFIPALSEATGKTSASNYEQRGIFQISVYVPVAGDNFDNDQLTAIDELQQAFNYGGKLLYNTQEVEILNNTVNSAVNAEAWYKRDISIEYLTFTTR